MKGSVSNCTKSLIQALYSSNFLASSQHEDRGGRIRKQWVDLDLRARSFRAVAKQTEVAHPSWGILALIGVAALTCEKLTYESPLVRAYSLMLIFTIFQTPVELECGVG